ncbi:Iron-uptake system permease protein FeuC [Gimesia alba]|uniref:Iron-uptake system permease protein FeuC n=1 Tax=Gimesia alba TaxID=2527973 RepID=A0A517RDN6_9PLAN|nr:iron ABC transporter permease [Gimesia alba]QDT41989.1 Iron-uptake system permease protein FeuC [Gimesia alba]
MTCKQIFLLLLGVLLAIALASLSLGNQSFSPLRLGQILFGEGDEIQRMILLSFRLPRILMAVMVGAALAVSGVLMQCVLRNDLAEPGIMGVSSGGNLGVSLAIIFGGSELISPWTLPVMSIVCAMTTVLLVCILAYDRYALSPIRLLLTGVAVSTAIGAFTLVLSLNVDRQAYARAVAWMAGSLNKADWNYVAALGGWLGITLPVVWSLHHIMNLLRLREETGLGLGLAVGRWRIFLLLFGVTIGAAAMSVVGSIAFVGLVAPHIGRRLVGPNHLPLLPAAALVGAALLLLADTLGRTLFLPVEMPAGVIVSALGGAYFLYLLMTTRG